MTSPRALTFGVKKLGHNCISKWASHNSIFELNPKSQIRKLKKVPRSITFCVKITVIGL